MVARNLGLLAAATGLVVALEDDLYSFVSRPDIQVPKLTVDSYDPASANPGLLFMTPNGDPNEGGDARQYGPVIYDNEGQLVWSGQAGSSGRNIRNAFVCSFQGKDHICYSESDQPGELPQHKILDESYNEVLSIRPVNVAGLPAQLGSDEHEFNVIPGLDSSKDNPSDHALVNAYLTQPYTATVCGKEIHFVNSYVFQDILLDGSNTATFTWNALDHIRPEEAVVCPGQDNIVNTGADAGSPFDFFHLNSIDKDENGDYLISSRHTSTLFKIAGANAVEPGKILWRLGGRQSHFSMSSAVDGETHEFAYQHHVRFANHLPGADASKGIIGITLWDNSNSDNTLADQIRPYSSGKSFLVDTNQMTAVMSEVFASPSRALDANQGSHQLLANGNHLLGEGNIAKVSEFNMKRDLTFSAHLSKHGVNSYRTLKFLWRGQPKSKPDVFAYSQSCEGGKTYIYTSWNGATDVHHYTIFTSMKRNLAFEAAQTVTRTGFETSTFVPGTKWVYVMAYDQNNKELGRSDIVSVWVPKGEDVRNGECSESRCNVGFSYKHHGRRDCTRQDMQLRKRKGEMMKRGVLPSTTSYSFSSYSASSPTSSSYSRTSPTSSSSSASSSQSAQRRSTTTTSSSVSSSSQSRSSSSSQSQSSTKSAQRRSTTTTSSGSATSSSSKSAQRRSTTTSSCSETTYPPPYPTSGYPDPYPTSGYPMGYTTTESCYTTTYVSNCPEGPSTITETLTDIITIPCPECTEVPYPQPYPAPAYPTGGSVPQPQPQPQPQPYPQPKPKPQPQPQPQPQQPAYPSGAAPAAGSGSGGAGSGAAGCNGPNCPQAAPAAASGTAPAAGGCTGPGCPVPLGSKTQAMPMATGAAASLRVDYIYAGLAAILGLAML